VVVACWAFWEPIGRATEQEEWKSSAWLDVTQLNSLASGQIHNQRCGRGPRSINSGVDKHFDADGGWPQSSDRFSLQETEEWMPKDALATLTHGN
jgi:hypothetical protein